MRGTFYTRLELGVVEPQNWNLFELCTQTATVDDQGQNSFGETILGTQLSFGQSIRTWNGVQIELSCGLECFMRKR